MAEAQIVVIIVGLIAGYWLVSRLFDRFGRSAQPRAESNRPEVPRDSGETAWWEVLEVAPTAPMEVVHASYRRLIAGYHPDRVHSLGRELRELAEAKSRQINAAFDEARRARQ